MTALYSDTHPEMEALQIQIIRRMPAWKKIAIVDDLNATIKALAISGIRERHPDATPQEIARLLADYRLGPELARKVYDHGG
jgi:hypothetical protein